MLSFASSQYMRLFNMALPIPVKMNTDNDHALINASLLHLQNGHSHFNDWLRDAWQRAVVGYDANQAWLKWSAGYESIEKKSLSEDDMKYVIIFPLEGRDPDPPHTLPLLSKSYTTGLLWLTSVLSRAAPSRNGIRIP